MRKQLNEEIIYRLYETEMSKIINECVDNGIDLDQLTEQELNELFGGVRQRFGNLMRGQGFKTDKDALHDFRMKHDKVYQSQQAAKKHKDISNRIFQKTGTKLKNDGRLPIKNASGLVTGHFTRGATSRMRKPFRDQGLEDRASRSWDYIRQRGLSPELGNKLNATKVHGYKSPKDNRLAAERLAARKTPQSSGAGPVVNTGTKSPTAVNTGTKSPTAVNTGTKSGGGGGRPLGRRRQARKDGRDPSPGVPNHIVVRKKKKKKIFAHTFVDRVGIKLVEMRLKRLKRVG